MKKSFLIFSIIIFPFLTACHNSTSKEPEISFNENILEKAPTDDDLTFFITTDWHYLSNNLTDNGEAFQTFIHSGGGKLVQDMELITDAFSNEISEQQPEVLIISGDLTTNGEKQSHMDVAKKLDKIEESGTSVYVIPGNHDINNPWARAFKADRQYKVDTVNATEFSEIYSEFGYDDAISKDPSSLSYLATPSEDVWLLMLDTNQYQENETKGNPEISGEISKESLTWISASFDFAKEKGATIIPVMHHNLVDHNALLTTGYTVNNQIEVIDLLETHTTPFVLSGHIHAQDISSVKTNYGKMYDIATSSIAIYPQQYGVLHYQSKEQLFNYHTQKTNVEKWASKSGIDNKGFEQYSHDFFGESASDMIYEKLPDNDDLSKEEMQYLADTMELLNIRYFSGTEYLNEEDLLLDERFKLWQEIPNEFLKKYVQSIQTDQDSRDNLLEIKIVHHSF